LSGLFAPGSRRAGSVPSGMIHRTLGATGMNVSVLGFGGAEIGYQSAEQETVNRLLNEALDAGLNVIDTAECYRNSEELIGHGVGHRRKDFFLFTKVGHASGIDPPLPDWDPRLIERSIERSLKRLKTDRVDLVQLHSCDEATLRRGHVIEALQRAKAAGKTRFIGYSGDSVAAEWAVKSGHFDTLQTSVNLADQECLELTLPVCVKKNMGVIAKRPIANAAWTHASEPVGNYGHEYWKRLRALEYPALRETSMMAGEAADAQTGAGDALAAELALRFTLAAPGVGTMIVGTKRPGRWRENAEAVAKGPLGEEEFKMMRGRWKVVAMAGWVGQV
jgi:aryl-alcohol dehydrogenase-like predicted oxidoreductase